MKKYILPILFLLPLSSCKDFLEEKMVSTITQDYFETEKGAEELVVASYNTLRWKYGFMEGPFLFETVLTLPSRQIITGRPSALLCGLLPAKRGVMPIT